MEVTRSQQGPVVILALRGPLVAKGLEELDAKIGECSTAGLFRIVLEMRESPFIDSAGLEKLQSIALDMGKRGGDVRIASLNDVCRDIFLATRMESLVQVCDDRETAVRSLL